MRSPKKKERLATAISRWYPGMAHRTNGRPNREEEIMTTILRSSLCVSAALLAGAAAASSQHHPESHHRHYHGVAAPSYDIATEITRRCKVDSIDEVVPGDCRGCDGGIHLRATCDGEACDVHLGPAAYAKDKKFQLVKGDEIDVIGSRVSYDGGTSLIAREVRKGEAVLQLRDEQGLPLWRKGTR
jgi:hypothetical protein